MAPRSSTELASRLEELTKELGQPMTLDGLTKDFKIFQRRRGHRHSTDDLLTAWYAATHAGAQPCLPRRLLDLGTGIGSVGLAVLWFFGGQDPTLTAVEVQPESFRLLQENVWANGVEARVRAIHGDLRDVTSAAWPGRGQHQDAVPPGEFDLVTGSPPYFDVKSGIVSADPQRAGARFELCGDVGDYCRAARRALAPGGLFVFCFPTVQRARAERACEAAALQIVATRDVVPKLGLAPLFSLFACKDGAGEAKVEPAMVVRDADGTHTPEMLAARALFGMGPGARA